MKLDLKTICVSLIFCGNHGTYTNRGSIESNNPRYSDLVWSKSAADNAKTIPISKVICAKKVPISKDFLKKQSQFSQNFDLFHILTNFADS